jgi:hypothetical protein
LLIIHGMYRFRHRRIAFRNDYCLSCAQPRRSVQIRTFDTCHIFWIPFLPLGFHKRWFCTACNKEPHVHPGTRRGFKWAGFVVLLIFSAATWAVPPEPEEVVFHWVVRIATPLGAILTLIHLLRTPKDPMLREKFAAIPPASDTACSFCGATPLLVSAQASCPYCAILRS